MRSLISLVLVVVMALTCIGLVACDNGGSETAPPPSGGGTTPSPSGGEATPPSSGSGLTWNDFPVYSGAEQVQEMAFTIPPGDDDWSKMEWRYYEVGASVGNVVAFYKAQMPGNGWEEMAWMEMPEMSWGYYSKNNEQDGAMVWVGAEENKTFFALMRANK